MINNKIDNHIFLPMYSINKIQLVVTLKLAHPGRYKPKLNFYPTGVL
jgi:hypothetical protein